MGDKIVKYGNYIAGWLDSSVHDFLLHLPSAFPSTHYALITCLDSNRELSELLEVSPEFDGIKTDAKRLGHGVLIPTRVLLNTESSNQILFGFDEVFFFPDEDIDPKPPGIGLVGPRRISQERMDALGKWMKSNSCSLALGDGEGLNFIIQARGLVRYFVGNSIQQPAPATSGTK
ncbi:MAG TPA: hypothetical protein VHZ24_12125 [Pirellulales bacterium]|jgi:hypothetical protein|nr:hypothetical protein [Pirellulales bacterium]